MWYEPRTDRACETEATQVPTTAAEEPATMSGDDSAAFSGAQLVREWRWEDGGWSSLLADSGARVAAVGYLVGSRAAQTGSGLLELADLEVDGDGELESERVDQLRSAVIGAELNRSSELMERLVLALERAFDTGIRRACGPTTGAPGDGSDPPPPST